MSTLQRSRQHPGAAVTAGAAWEATTARYAWAVARLALAFVFLWAFLDKTFGLGTATPTEGAWLNGGSPTTGYLSNVQGPFAGVFNSIAGQAWADWLFMLGLLGIGLALLLGVGMRMAAGTGALLLMLMWAASLPLANNPFVDDHLVYAVVLIGLAAVRAGDTLGLGRPWGASQLVQRHPILR